MDFITFFFVSSPFFYTAIFILLLVHVILSERHNRRSEQLEQQIIELLNGRRTPQYTYRGIPTRETPVPVSNKIV